MIGMPFHDHGSVILQVFDCVFIAYPQEFLRSEKTETCPQPLDWQYTYGVIFTLIWGLGSIGTHPDLHLYGRFEKGPGSVLDNAGLCSSHVVCHDLAPSAGYGARKTYACPLECVARSCQRQPST